ncbi:MAG: SRPBCC family protein [Deltaproteobacteria bacterium]|nr:SRPBCC family protein [Deltaproteobacteria bacterium]
MGQAHVSKKIHLDAPIDLVFERITDHEAMNDWPGIGACRLVKEGTPRNGLGAVREVKARGLGLLEEVVHYEPPFRYDYKITKGLPVDHLGSVRLSPTEGGVELSWEVQMTSRWPFVCEVVGNLLGKGLDEALAWFKAETEKVAAER